jgi:lipopolysaccharide export system permease protein
MKKIDKLLLSSFVGPFAVSFGIALFVLVMQFLWLYIDEIAGKGVSILIMMELLGYLSISTFPMALPIAILIASVMVMGNLAERYELSSMKSAGVPLIRILRSLIIAAAGIAVFSYVCSDFIIPWANLKFKSRLYDIRKQKPALTLEKGVFNEDFRQFIIRIGDKARDGETISDVMIEDQTSVGRVKFNQILADSGQMYTTGDKRFFVMNLFRGTQYQEPGTQSNTQKQKYPFIRTNFKSWTKVWDMKEFELVRTSEDRFNSQRSMMSMNQLRAAMDSLQIRIRESGQNVATDIVAPLKVQLPAPPQQALPPTDTAKIRQNLAAAKKPITDSTGIAKKAKIVAQRRANRASVGGPRAPIPVFEKPLREYTSFTEGFKAEDLPPLLKEAKTRCSSTRGLIETRKSQAENRHKEWVKTGYELYTKYSFALVCFVFLFIGAPMGAIIRKGGFGYPILVSIIFFVAFIMLTILCRKLAESGVMSPFWAAMMPCAVLVPVGIYLTRKAMNDSQLFSTERLDRFVNWLRARLEKRLVGSPSNPTV